MPPTHDRTWLAQRALLAVTLTVGFYVLALTSAVALIALPFAEYYYAERFDLMVAVWATVGFGILAALWPRPSEFAPPGPRLDAADHPALFALIRDVAAATNQEEPREVYVFDGLNAWVSQRGGRLGVGGQRIMAIGLPLLRTLTVSEFRAVVAHEFGHYCSGDVALGPWIHRTWNTMVRTVGRAKVPPIRAMLAWYSRLYMRLTRVVSRRQEFIADEVAARVAGAANMASALKRVGTVHMLRDLYLSGDVRPVVAAGFLPPIAAGFETFLATDRVKALMPACARDVESRAEGAFDTHPPLAERLAALALLSGERRSDDRPAASLVRHLDRLDAECPLPAGWQGLRPVLSSISWADVAEHVHIPRWQALRKSSAAWLATITVDALPVDPVPLLSRLRQIPGSEAIDDQRLLAFAIEVIGAAIAVMLMEVGWAVSWRPGDQVRLCCGGDEVCPFDLVHGVLNGRVNASDYAVRWTALNLVGRPLAPPVAEATQEVTTAVPRFLQLDTVRFGPDGAAEMERARALVFIPHDDIVSVELIHAAGVSRPLLVGAIGVLVVAFSIALALGLVFHGNDTIRIGPRLFSVIAFAIPGAALVRLATRRRWIVMVDTTSGSRRLIFQNPPSEAEMNRFVDAARERFGYA